MDRDPAHILLIEDNDEQVVFLRKLLAESDAGEFEIHVAGDLEMGLARLKDGGIQLILLDLSLPDSDGLETFLRVIEAEPDLPLVVLSGIGDVALAIEIVQLGAQDYLVKGHVDNHLLIRSLQYAIERKRIQIQIKRANDQLEFRVRERTDALLQMNTKLQQEIAVRRAAEDALTESNRQLATAMEVMQATQREMIQRERMNALGRMANGIAHDFNNGLAPIVGFSELLLNKPDLFSEPEKVRNYLQMIHAAAQSTSQVANRLREFYRRRDETETFAPVSINNLIKEVIPLTQPRWKDQALGAGIQINFRTELGDVPTVPANESELREMLVNLVFNAIEAIPKRGTITMRTEVRRNRLLLTVADDGVGMTEEVKARCMEPFFTTKHEQNTGFGLGMVYGIVRRHEAEIDINSEPGRGTDVIISLPLERSVRETEPAEAPKPAPASLGRLRILVVEDEPLVRELLGVYLTEEQHEFVTAVNGRDGLDKFREGTFDIVMTDRAMPEMNGDALAAEIKRVKPSQAIILLTGFGDLMASTGEKPTGIDLVVGKPFTLGTLRNAIAKVIERPPNE
jgi:signal transduction histidine kinase